MENNIIPTSGVLIIKDGKVLLVRHGEASEHLNGRYGLPAGRIQDSESEKEAVRRELKEETGLDVDLDSLIQLPGEWFADIERKGGVKKLSMKVFLADSGKIEGLLKGNPETVPEWIDTDDIEKRDLLPNVSDIIKEGLRLMSAPE